MSFWRDLWASFKAVSGPIIVVVGLVLAILGPLYLPAATVQLSVIWIVVAAIVVATALLTAWNLVAAARLQARSRLPRTWAAYLLEPETPETSPVALLLDGSDLFGFNLLVSIYYNELLDGRREGSFERLIGMGRVSNFQQDGLMQIQVLSELAVHAETWRRIRRREAATLAHVIVKPSVPYGEAGVEVRFYE